MTEVPPGAWNAGSLHAHFSTRLEDIEKRVNAVLVDLQAQMDRRIDTQMRERQDTERHLNDQIATLTSTLDKTDRALREHVSIQVRQLEQTLAAANRETDIVRDASEKAIAKSEATIFERLRDLNKVRQEVIIDRGQFATREMVESEIRSLTKQLDIVEKDLDQRRGGEDRLLQRQQHLQPWMIWVAGALVAGVSVLANVLT